MNVYSEHNPPPGHTYWYDEDGAAEYCECAKFLEISPPYYSWGHHLRHIVEELPDAAWDEDDRACDSCTDGGIDVHTDLTYAPMPQED